MSQLNNITTHCLPSRWWGTALVQAVRPPLNKKVFPAHRPGGLKRADSDFFFHDF